MTGLGGRAVHAVEPQRVLANSTSGYYPAVGLRVGTRATKTFTVHRLVADAFLGPRPPGHVVRHGPAGPADPSVWNLSYGTMRENMHDKLRDGTFRRGSTAPNAKLTESQVAEIRRMYAEGDTSQNELAALFGVARGAINSIIAAKTWGHVSQKVPLVDGRAHRNAACTPEQAMEIRQLYASGRYSQAELGEKYGVSRAAICGIVTGRKAWKRLGSPLPLADGRSTRRSTLTSPQAESIRREYAAGDISQVALCAKYGVTRSTIGSIIRGETWVDAGGPIQSVDGPVQRASRRLADPRPSARP